MRRFIATRDFNDAGTGQSFTADQPVEASEGQIVNFAAAGLVSAEPTALELDATSVVDGEDA